MCVTVCACDSADGAASPLVLAQVQHMSIEDELALKKAAEQEEKEMAEREAEERRLIAEAEAELLARSETSAASAKR